MAKGKPKRLEIFEKLILGKRKTHERSSWPPGAKQWAEETAYIERIKNSKKPYRIILKQADIQLYEGERKSSPPRPILIGGGDTLSEAMEKAKKKILWI